MRVISIKKIKDFFNRLTSCMTVFSQDHRGVSAIEAAIIIPVLVILYFGLIDVFYLATAKGRLSTLNDTVADLISQSKDTITKAEILGIYDASKTILEGYPITDLAISVTGYRRNGTSVVVRWSHNNGRICSAAAPLTPTVLADLTKEGNDIVIANTCLSVPLITKAVIGSAPVALSSQAIKRPRYSTTLMCSDC